MASCSLWSARTTRRWQSSSARRRGTPVNIRKPANAAAASTVFPKSELFKRCRIGVASSLTVFNELPSAPTPARQERTQRHGTNIILSLIRPLFAHLFSGTLLRQSLLHPASLARLQVVGVTLYFPNDVLRLNLTLEATEGVFY